MWVHVVGFSIMRGLGGLFPQQPKLWLIPPVFPQVPQTICSKNADVALFMQFLTVLAKGPPTTVDLQWKTMYGCMSRMLMPTTNTAS